MTPDANANVVCLLRAVADRAPGRLAFAAPKPLTFAALVERVDRFASGLRRFGLCPGDRVLCLVPMSPDLYVTLLGILQAGGTAVFVDPWVAMPRIAAFAAFAEPRGFVGVPRSHALRLLQPGLRRLPLTVTLGRRLGPLPARSTFAELLARPGDGAVHRASAGDPALITFTSGSGGDPKGANRTHGFLRAQHAALCAEFEARPGEDMDMTMFPVFALSNLAQGVTTVIPDLDFRNVAATDGARIAAQMRRHGVTTCTASPPFFDRLAAAGSPPPLRRILTGGAPVTDTQLRRWAAAWPAAEIVVVYGSTEAEPVAHLNAAERLAARSALHPATPGFCAGRVSAHLRARVVRITRSPASLGDGGWAASVLPPGAIGELVVAGDHVCRDYFRNPRAVAENKITTADGTTWHRMGDTGYLDAEGRFWLTGRLHSTIWRDGAPVHPQLVEQAASVPGVRQAAAVGIPDAAHGEKVVLAVVPEGAGPDVPALLARLDSLGLSVDDVVVLGGSLPMDPRHNAKVDYAALRRRLGRRRR